MQQAAESAFSQNPRRSAVGQFSRPLVTELESQADEPFFDLGPVNLPRVFRRYVEWRTFHAEDGDFVGWLRQSDHNSVWRRNGAGPEFQLADALDDGGGLREDLQPWEIIYHQDAHDVPGEDEYSESADNLNNTQRGLRVEVELIPN